MGKRCLAQSKAVNAAGAVLLMACAASLTGCAASSNSELAARLAANEQPASIVLTGGSAKAGQQTSVGRRPRSAEEPTLQSAGNAAYKIGALDVLDISVFKVPELSKSVQVADTGTINLPLVGEIQAAGKTAQQLERDLASKLGAKYLQSPQVTVYVKEHNSQRATIEGAVRKPGVYPIRGKTSLLQFVAIAQGLDPSSDSTAVVFREINGRRSAGKFDIDAIRGGRANDPAIQQGDVIVVGTSAIKAAFNNILKVLPVASVFTPLL
jgi:polysaccharide export outer membrane protein